MESAQPFELTVLQKLDKLVAEQPDALYFIQPVSTDIADGWKDVSFRDLADAIEYMALWIYNEVPSTDGPSTLAYLGRNDVRYSAFVYACMRHQHTAVLLSSRNSEHASSHILGATGCSRIFYTPERARQVDALQAANTSIQTWQVPDLWEVFGGEPIVTDRCLDIPAPGSDFEDRVAVYIHSSGTTGKSFNLAYDRGFDKVNNVFIRVTQAGSVNKWLLSGFGKCRANSLVVVAEPGKPFFSMSPFFHIMGLFNIVAPLWFGTPILLSPDKPLTIDLVSRIIDEKMPETSLLPPSILEELSSTDSGMEVLSKFSTIVFGGAPLSPAAGDRISGSVHLQGLIGSSENGVFGTLKHMDKADWSYFEWNPNHGIEMRDIGNNLHELVLPRGDSRAAHCVYHSFPDLEEYCTGDLYTKHPSKIGLWQYTGRVDDVIVLSNGEKFNPTSMETIISSHPLISRTVIFGQGRFQPGVLVEPNYAEWEGQQESLVDEIWPVIQRANETAPGHAQLMKDKVGVSSNAKPFRLTPKGTIKRRVVLQDYADEIEALYTIQDNIDVQQIEADAPIVLILTHVTALLCATSSVDLNLTEDDDIFASGVDSLHTLRFGQMLRASLRSTCPTLLETAFSNQQLYSHPTIGSLTKYIWSLIHGGTPVLPTSMTETNSERKTRLADLVSRYSDSLGESHVVILTGSTGNLGEYLLHELLRDRGVSKIYCLNRDPDAASTQWESMYTKGLATFSQFMRRVEFLEANFGLERLGLEDEKYEALLLEVDTIIHNAWEVNFNYQVETFENPHILGVRELIDFSIASEKTAHVHFVSSIATIEGYGFDKGPSIPEIIFTDPTVALRQGYAESKHVSERICAGASIKAGVPTSIHRVGQICGPTTMNGMWNMKEWLPSLIATSKTIKQIPSSLGSATVQWVPLDIAAKVITEIVRSRRATQEDERCAAFHIVNPNATNWESLVPSVTEYTHAEPVPLQQWIQTLESFDRPTEMDLQDKPALKILDFYRTIARGDEHRPWTETTKAQEASKSLRQLKAVDAYLVATWMSQWGFIFDH
ncbi:unnamed protein product [Penicillium olsonii]|uniref:Carrier domain-containing protein n=1 Tax=Penicillium olsonii TaxID=99116 RepID=A0A9W4H9F5_PENOL|nr:unnamed protein product [Penicillium olsonii]CAG8269757.1 unnamed protein product [Penicillium olsonii]